ncbi:hypothetical protein SAY86_030191 [Trapa natans]|uniref:Uncharacterized protein n=1 Tax=Trapa natans TaxID=22666 RepID=A0AAN7M2G3_TRANT|nr:hypothetical protein SAY86_030191 [Trapa natans]
MRVEIRGTSIVLPPTPPFNEPHALPLSHLDSHPNLRVAFRYVRAFSSRREHIPPPESGHIDPLVAISNGLSAALIHYYPFAATLRPCPNDPRRLELFSSPSGQGVPLIHAAANCTLESVEYLDGLEESTGFVEQLAADPTLDQMMINPCILQVTIFKCGGFTLGATINHAMCDGAGATQFFWAISELSRGAGKVSVEPVWDRAALLGPRDPPRVVAPIEEEVRGQAMVTGEGGAAKVVVREWVHVGDDLVEMLKAGLVEKCGVRFTTFEALGAFIWRAKVRASGIPVDDRVTFSYSINITKIVKPPLPVGYWGNCCVPVYVDLIASELVNGPIWQTANRIRDSKTRVTDEYVRSYIDLHELTSLKDGGAAGATKGRSGHVSGFTDWRHLGHSKLDFGWGGPVSVVPLTRNILGSEEPCFFLPYSAPSGGKGRRGGFKVLVNLPEGSVTRFREEMEKLFKRGCGL